MRNWIINTFFSDYRQRWIESATRSASMDAFKKAHADVLETMRDDLDKQAEELAKKKLNDLLAPIDLNSVVTLNKQLGAVFIGGQRIDEGRLASLKAEAELFIASDLWHLLQETPKKLAEQAMFVAGDSVEDMKKGRSILYCLSSQRNIIDTFRSAKTKPLAPGVRSSV